MIFLKKPGVVQWFRFAWFYPPHCKKKRSSLSWLPPTPARSVSQHPEQLQGVSAVLCTGTTNWMLLTEVLRGGHDRVLPWVIWRAGTEGLR